MQILPPRDGQARTGKLVAFIATLVLVSNVAALADHRDPQAKNVNPNKHITAATNTTTTSDQPVSDLKVSGHTADDDVAAIRAAQVTLPDGANNIEPATPTNESSADTSTANAEDPVTTPEPEPEHDHDHAPEPTPEPEPEPEPAHDHTHEPAPEPEPEPEPDPCGDTPQHECRGQAQLDKVTWPWQQAGWTIEFEPGREYYKGMTYPSRDTIVVWVRESESDASILGTIGHEIGHVADFEYLTDTEKEQYKQIRGLDPEMSWYPCTGEECGEGEPDSDHDSPAGDYAEAFMWCKITTADHFSSELAGPPSDSQCQQLEPLFAAN